jgi:hypothetical protein
LPKQLISPQLYCRAHLIHHRTISTFHLLYPKLLCTSPPSQAAINCFLPSPFISPLLQLIKYTKPVLNSCNFKFTITESLNQINSPRATKCSLHPGRTTFNNHPCSSTNHHHQFITSCPDQLEIPRRSNSTVVPTPPHSSSKSTPTPQRSSHVRPEFRRALCTASLPATAVPSQALPVQPSPLPFLRHQADAQTSPRPRTAHTTAPHLRRVSSPCGLQASLLCPDAAPNPVPAGSRRLPSLVRWKREIEETRK